MSWVLPILCWSGLAVCFVRRGADWRCAWLTAALLWGGTVVLLTEVLGKFRLLSPVPLAVGWASASAVAGLLLVGSRAVRLSPGRPGFTRTNGLPLLIIGLIALVTLVTALASPPNNFDSMTYHMSRVAHWVQNRSVDHYPTHITRQLDMNPWAEFAILHFQILSDGDRLANLVQWFSMLGSLVGVSLITARFGGDARAQLLSACVAATIPMGILQASNTQNDWVLTFWLVCLVWSGLQVVETGHLRGMLLFGLALGLAVLTKGTAYPYALPIVLWAIALTWRRHPRLTVRFVLVISLVALILNAGHYQRNLGVFRTPFLSDGHRYANAAISPAVVLSNVARGMALHFATPLPAVNAAVESMVRGFHDLIGADADDPDTTWEHKKFKLPVFKLHEDTSGNLLHVLWVVAAVTAVVARPARRRQWGPPAAYAVAVLAGFVLFCTILRWQPWHSRLHLPLFVLLAPVCALAVAGVGRAATVNLCLVALLVTASPYAVFNYARPLLPLDLLPIRHGVPAPHDRSILFLDRETQYFAGQPELQAGYVSMAEKIRASGARSVGLWVGWDGYEYPLWVLLKQPGPLPLIRHVEVGNPTAELNEPDFRPEQIVIVDGNGIRLRPGLPE